MPIRVDDPRPPYLQLADELRTAIRTGTYQPGDRLPSARQLASENGIALMTVQHAMKLLHEEGLVVSQQRRGVYVSEPAADAEPEAASASTPQTLDEALTMLAELQERMTRLEAGSTDPGAAIDAGVDRSPSGPDLDP